MSLFTPLIGWRGFCLISAILVGCVSTVTAHESFSEELLVRPLPGGKVLLHFHFTSELQRSANRHHRIFPKAVDQLVRKFSLQDLELSFTQGRWDYSRWGAAEGVAPLAAKPPGVELLAQLGAGSEAEADATWRNLTHALSGIFCASVNALADPATKVAPVFSFRTSASCPSAFGPCPVSDQPRNGNGSSGGCTGFDTTETNHAKRNDSRGSRRSTGNAAGQKGTRGGENGNGDGNGTGFLRYGALPREAVCTENLTPWLKLLPCRDRAGLATLLERRRVYGGFYHALQVRIRAADERADVSKTSVQGNHVGGASLGFGKEKGMCSAEEERADVSKSRQGDVSRRGADVRGGILLEQTLTLVLAVGKRSVVEAGGLGVSTKVKEVSLNDVFGKALGASCPLADVSRLYVEGDRKEGTGKASSSAQPSETWFSNGKSKALLEFDLKRAPLGQPLNVTLVFNGEHLTAAKRAPFEVSRFATGHGLERGGIRLELIRLEEGEGNETIPVRFFQLLPWFIRAYFYTLRLEFDGRHVPLSDWTEGVSLVPAKDRERQAAMDLQLRIPAGVTRAVLSMEFDKGYLRISEHPPDGDRGFDLPSAVLTFPSVAGGVTYRASKGSGEEAEDSRGVEGRPLLARMQEALPVRVYTPGLLIPLATPDFSMPYNVITLTSTVIAMIFSSLFNTLLQKETGSVVGNAAPFDNGGLNGFKHESRPRSRRSALTLWKPYLTIWNLSHNRP